MSSQFNKYIEYTNLKPDTKPQNIAQICTIAKKLKMRGVCIGPAYVSIAKKLLKGTDMSIVTVIGFPLGINKLELKLDEAETALKEGATDIDFSPNLGAIKDHNTYMTFRELSMIVERVKKISPKATVRIITEVSLLNKQDFSFIAHLAQKAGVHYFKTSSGFLMTRETNAADIKMIASITSIPIKATGGIRTVSHAQDLIKAGASLLGTSQFLEE